MPYYTKSYNPNVGVSNPLYAIPRVQEVNQRDAELAFNEQEMAAYLAAEAARNPNFVLDRNAAAKQRYDAMVGRNKRLNEDPTFQPGVGVPQPITNVTEVGPAGYQPPKPLPPLSTMEVSAPAYQPGYQGGLDFANPPDNKYGKSLLDGIKQGSKAAIDQKQGLLSQQQPPQEQGFFGNIGDYINEDFLGRVLAIMARPEAFTDPRGLGAGIARAGQAVFAQEKEQAAAKAKAQLEYDKIQADLQKEAFKAGKRPEFKQFMAKMVTDVRQQKQGLDTVQKIKRLLGKEGAGGIAGAFDSFVRDAGAIFGASGGQSVNQQIEKYNAYLLSSLGSGIASGQISQEDYKRIDAMLKAPGITTDAGKLLDAYNEVERVVGNAYKTNADMLREVGYGTLIEPSVARDRGVQVPD